MCDASVGGHGGFRKCGIRGEGKLDSPLFEGETFVDGDICIIGIKLCTKSIQVII